MSENKLKIDLEFVVSIDCTTEKDVRFLSNELCRLVSEMHEEGTFECHGYEIKDYININPPF